MKAIGRWVFWTVTVVGCALLAWSMAFSQPAGTPGKTGEPKKLGTRNEKKNESSQVRINKANRARYDPTRKLFYLVGDVEFQDEDVKVNCDEATYSEEDDTAACAGNLRITDPENVITGLFVNADFGAEIVSIEGDVKIVTTKRPKSENSQEGNPDQEKRVTTITCDKIVYVYTEGKRHAVATGNLKAVQKDKTLVAQRADYDRETDIIVLGDAVKITMENGNEFNATRATISATEEWVEMEGFTGIAIREKKKPAESTSGPPGGGTPAPPPAGAGAGGG